MTRQILAFVAAFVLALAGTTGVVLVRAKSARAQAPSRPAVKADSARAQSVVDSTRQAVDSAMPPTATKPAPASPSSKETAALASSAVAPAARVAAPADSARKTPAVAQPVSQPAPQASTQNPASRPTMIVPGVLVGGRLSKIFAAMSSKEAAKVLEQMDDADVVAILGSENDRKAAEILALLPTARAAVISKSVMKVAPVSK